jgi:hypothetical protein
MTKKMGKYVRVTRNDVKGNYVQRIEDVKHALDGELDGAKVGDAITFTVIELPDEEYDNSPEFQGW